MMKKLLLKTSLRLVSSILMIVFICMENVSAFSLLNESFNYSVGSLGSSNGTNGGWKSLADNIIVSSGSLSYQGYKNASDLNGNMLSVLDNTTESIYKPFSGSIISGDIFASFLFNANKGMDDTGNVCLGGLLESTSGSTIRLGFFVTNGTDPSKDIKFGIGTSSSNIKGTLSSDFPLGSTYLIVLRARQNVVGTIDSIWMYVNPDLSNGSLPSKYTIRAYGNEPYFQGFGAWTFRTTNTGAFNVNFDELKVGTTWQDAPGALYIESPQIILKDGSLKDLSLMQTSSTNINYSLIGTANKYTIQYTKDGNPVNPDFISDIQSGNDVTLTIAPTLTTISGDYVYTITPSDNNTSGTPISGTISVSAYSPPAPTFSTTSSTTQTVKANTAITDIIYTIGNATNATVSGLPQGVTGVYNNGTFTIAGTPGVETTYPVVYNYTVTVTPLAGYIGTALTTTGKITVKDPNGKNVALLYTSTNPTAITGANKYYSELSKYYNVTLVAASNTAADTAAIMSNLKMCDLVILHEAVASSNLTAQRLGKYIGTFPILNTKAHMYSKPNWPAGTGQGGTAGTTISATVQDVYLTHPIFKGVTITNNVVTMAGSTGIIRWLTGATTTGLSVIANNSTNASGNISILENNTAGGSKKYMLIALAAANEDLTANGLLVIKNACDYLMSSDVFVAPKNTNAKILSMTIGGAVATIDETSKTVVTNLAQGTDLSSLAVNLTMSTGATLTAPVSLTSVDFSNPVVFSIQAEDSSIAPINYSVTVTNVTSAIDEPVVSSNISFYPNPAKTHLSFQNITDNTNVEVYNMNGTHISDYTLNKENSVINISNLNKGVYVLTIKTKNRTYKQKLLKE